MLFCFPKKLICNLRTLNSDLSVTVYTYLQSVLFSWLPKLPKKQTHRTRNCWSVIPAEMHMRMLMFIMSEFE